MIKCFFCLLLVCGSFFLSSCSGLIEPNIEDLLHPPRLTAERNDIYNALETATGQTLKLKYPKTGDYLSAFVMYDLDGDGEEEALVFYEDPHNESVARMNILDRRGESWLSLYDHPGDGADVHQVKFVNLSGQKGCDILVGWENAADDSKVLNVYNFQTGADRPLKSLFKEPYTELAVFDFFRDGYDDVVLLDGGVNSGLEYDAKLVSRRGGRRGELAVVSQYKMSWDFGSFISVQSGKTADGKLALYIDGYLTSNKRREFINESLSYREQPALYSGDRLLCSEVLYLQDGELRSHLIYDTDNYSEQTVRSQPITCMDINNDGIMEVPMPLSLRGYEQSTENDQMFITEFCSLDSMGIREVVPAVVNLENNYRILIPEKWEEKITITQPAKSNEWRFWAYTGSLNNLTDELLRIKVYAPNDYHDKFENETYQKLDTEGQSLLEYYVYIPPSNQPDLAITYQELREMFSLLS